MMLHKGSCHCGMVAIEVETDLELVVECNCSICRRKGYVLAQVPRHALKVLRGTDDLSTYTFHTHTIQHRFCKACGCAMFAEGVRPTGEALAAINVRCLDDVDMTNINSVPFDGQAL